MLVHDTSTDVTTVAEPTDAMVTEAGPSDEGTDIVTEGDVDMDGEADQDDSEGSEEEMVDEDCEHLQLSKLGEVLISSR